MRLDFNVILVDDELDDPDNSRTIIQYKNVISERLKLKGFNPIIETYSNADFVKDLPLAKKKRVDLYISDNNLGDAEHEIKEGIDLYLHLKQEFQCDFLLYTRSNKQTIIQKLVADLNAQQDPNLFTKFSFVSRGDKAEWHSFTYELLNHIVKKREEINNLRGLFAEKISKIHNALKLKNGHSVDHVIDFIEILDNSLEERLITLNQWQRLTKLRYLRNSLLHNNEIYDDEYDHFKISYEQPRFRSDSKKFDLEEKWLIESTSNYAEFRRELDYIVKELI